MPPQQKPKKPGRPKLSKAEYKGKIVPVRFAPDDLKRIEQAAKAKDQTLSQWIRGTLIAATDG
jgi:predicted HicB family RNase H-like nuclease